MKKSKMKFIYCVVIFLLFIFTCKSYAGETKQNDTSQEYLIVYILKELFPELENPRLMKFSDLNDKEEKENFISGGYSFVLESDFNNDGQLDLAFVGKYKSTNIKTNSFIAIVSSKGKKIYREYFKELEIDRASIILEKKSKKRGAILILRTIASDECAYLFWTGKKYELEICKSVF